MENSIAQGGGLLSAILIFFVIFSKDIRRILIFETITNLVMAVIYFCLGGISASGTSIIATVQTYIFYLYTSKNKSIPKPLIILFLAIYAVWYSFTVRNITDILPPLCVLFYVLAIMQKDPTKYRTLKVFNAGAWIIYDILVAAFTTIITHGIVFVSALAAIITVDLKNIKRRMRN